MKKCLFAVAAGVALTSLPLMGAGAKGPAPAPVADGFPAWTGVLPKNHVCGRVLRSNSELRQRVTIIVEFDATKTKEQINLVGEVSNYNFLPTEDINWEKYVVPRGVLVVFVARNLKDREQFRKDYLPYDSVKDPGMIISYGRQQPIYENITFDGAPDNGGKLPFCYMMGAEGKEPIFKGPYEKGTMAALGKAMSAEFDRVAQKGWKWRPFYGYVDEPKHFTGLDKLIASGASLEPFMAKLEKGILSKDAEESREAQMLLDALEQTRNGYVFRVECEAVACPHAAACDAQTALKYWPKARKLLAPLVDKLKSDPEAAPLIRMYPKLRLWTDPGFTCKNAGEAKKIQAELKKMKKTLEPLREHAKNVHVQNGAFTLDGVIDELMATIPDRIAK